MTQTIKAIDTVYAGHRFRSRLEARWAVFFDTLGVRWEYEPQGYQVGEWNTVQYLPDFYLPDAALWVEVKGELDERSLRRMAWAAFPDDRGGLPGNKIDGNNLLVLGNLPAVGADGWPVHPCLTFYKGDVFVRFVAFAKQSNPVVNAGTTSRSESIADDCGGLSLQRATEEMGRFSHRRLVAGKVLPPEVRATLRAYDAARMARFEHGARGR